MRVMAVDTSWFLTHDSGEKNDRKKGRNRVHATRENDSRVERKQVLEFCYSPSSDLETSEHSKRLVSRR